MARLVTRPVHTGPDLDTVRQLCREYRAFLAARSEAEARVVETFYPEPVYEALLRDLPDRHGPPHGAIRLAELEGTPVGCGMSHRIGPGLAEIKRVYVQPEARGNGAGRALCEALIGDIRAAGFSRAVLDTSRSLSEARRLYESLGFAECGPFYDVPEAARDLLCYYEMIL